MMKKKYYIAYGSNLDVEQMKLRTPDATIVGTATLNGWQMLFKRYATIRPRMGKNVPVLVWEISQQDERNLDYYEGYPTLYYKQNLTVEVTPLAGGNARQLTAMVYIMDGSQPYGLPSNYYYGVLEQGYRRFGFDEAILKQAIVDSVGKKKASKFFSNYQEV